ncbi:MAG: helix-turn-helix domain-containing protein [Opitutales bacterium]
MKVEFEAVGRDQASSIKAFLHAGPRFVGPFHYHPEVEFVWIRSGQGRRLVGDHFADFVPGEMLLIGPNLPHLFASERSGHPAVAQAPSSAVVVQWLPDFLGSQARETPEMFELEALVRRARLGLRIAPRQARALHSQAAALPDLQGLERLCAFLQLMRRLGQLPATSLASPAHAPGLNTLASERIARACAHALEHLEEPLRLADVARLASLSPSAFSRLFRRVTGRTFQEFVVESRISRAQSLLRETDWSVLDVSLAAGFRNLANFNRLFRRLNRCTPREYRKRFAAAQS